MEMPTGVQFHIKEHHGLPAVTRIQEAGMEKILSQSLQKEPILPTPSFLASRLFDVRK